MEMRFIQSIYLAVFVFGSGKIVVNADECLVACQMLGLCGEGGGGDSFGKSSECSGKVCTNLSVSAAGDIVYNGGGGGATAGMGAGGASQLTCAQAAEMTGYVGVVPAGAPHVDFGAVGIRNMGNTCYMNSVMQVLGHSVPFLEFFLRLNKLEVARLAAERRDVLTAPEVAVVDGFAHVFSQMYSAAPVLDRDRLEAFRQALLATRARGSQVFADLVQSDVSEAATSMFHILDIIAGKVGATMFTSDVFGLTEVRMTQCVDEKDMVEPIRGDDEIITVLTASFNAVTEANTRVPIDLVDLLRISRAPEIVEDVAICGGRNARLWRQLVGEGPRTLLVSINRLGYNYETLEAVKINKIVTIPMELNLNSVGNTEDARGRYRLIGIVSHTGAEADEGHYLSEFKNIVGERVAAVGRDGRALIGPEGNEIQLMARKWFRANDATITELPGPTLSSGSSYLVAYERI